MVIAGEFVGDYGKLGDRLGNKHWLARVKKPGFLQNLFGNTIGGPYPTHSPDYSHLCVGGLFIRHHLQRHPVDTPTVLAR
jgi:hypothetical protein